MRFTKNNQATAILSLQETREILFIEVSLFEFWCTRKHEIIDSHIQI